MEENIFVAIVRNLLVQKKYQNAILTIDIKIMINK